MKIKALALVIMATLSSVKPSSALSFQEIQTWGTVVIAAPLAFQGAAQLTHRDEKTGHHRPLVRSGISLLSLATAYVLLGAYVVKELGVRLG